MLATIGLPEPRVEIGNIREQTPVRSGNDTDGEGLGKGGPPRGMLGRATTTTITVILGGDMMRARGTNGAIA